MNHWCSAPHRRFFKREVFHKGFRVNSTFIFPINLSNSYLQFSIFWSDVICMYSLTATGAFLRGSTVWVKFPSAQCQQLLTVARLLTAASPPDCYLSEQKALINSWLADVSHRLVVYKLLCIVEYINSWQPDMGIKWKTQQTCVLGLMVELKDN